MRVIKDVILLEGFKDRRGRIYSRDDILKQIEGQKFYGEFDNNNTLDIDLSKVSHYLENLTINNEDLVGDVVILDTTAGKLVETMLDAGLNFRTSIRATGMVGDGQSVTDLTLITFDLVRDNDERF